MQNDDKLLANYIPKVYTGNVAYLRCEGWYDGVDPVIGWSSLIEGDLEIIDVPGNHTEALNKPHVIEIATVYSNVLDAADVTDGSR
jgi:thioesterase domain-containing protein